ncbi:uncharacterized protein IUM83_03912 [Phytophthora cinnamomi]|uniref:uncharacterized protein n=1 Tax=Phytophthora cinnamomi TaxID=4785 RepID=UPI003559E97E|nr:hypothetical protein IUM83_03912 [Phytophthora cinnamomi]
MTGGLGAGALDGGCQLLRLHTLRLGLVDLNGVLQAWSTGSQFRLPVILDDGGATGNLLDRVEGLGKPTPSLAGSTADASHFSSSRAGASCV